VEEKDLGLWGFSVGGGWQVWVARGIEEFVWNSVLPVSSGGQLFVTVDCDGYLFAV